MREPCINPPFLPPFHPAEDPDFPVVISERAARRLYWHVIQTSHAGVGLLIHCKSGVQDIEFADARRLDPTEYRISRFGKISIAVLRSEELYFRGFMLDLRTFPPGGPSLHLTEMEGGLLPAASDPGLLRLSLRRLEVLHPELFRTAGPLVRMLIPFFRMTSQFGAHSGDTSWINRWVGINDPDGQSQVIESIAIHLWRGDANPAMVLALEPLIIAAYSPDIDNVMLLRFPQSIVHLLGVDLRPGTRLVTCNTYGKLPSELCDISLGPGASGDWTNCNCVIADFITDDSARLAELKNRFSEESWRQCELRSAKRLQLKDPCRDGRPSHSWVPTACQRLPQFRVRGGYA